MENKTLTLTGAAGGKHVVDGPLTTSNIAEASPALLRSDVDSRIVRIRPMSTPVDQISRWIGARQVSSMQVDYYSVDCKTPTANVRSFTEAEGPDSEFSGKQIYILDTDNNALFSTSETILVPTIDIAGKPLMFYVVSREATEAPRVVAVNWPDDANMPAVSVGKPIVRMGRAASELDVQTPQFSALPVKDFNYCQIFKAQIEQSLYAKLANKEVGWTFSDQEEVAIMDMRMGMEKNFLFGTKARLSNPANYDDVLLTEGIWNQAQGVVNLNDEMNEVTLTELMHKAFTGDAAGSQRKVLLAGGGLVKALSNLNAQRIISAQEKKTVWGLDFTEIVSKFGSLFVIYSEVFDQCGHQSDGLIIDPEYITKYVHVPFRIDLIDMHKTGVRNTQALVATEASCIVLRHPKAHLKVLG